MNRQTGVSSVEGGPYGQVSSREALVRVCVWYVSKREGELDQWPRVLASARQDTYIRRHLREAKAQSQNTVRARLAAAQRYAYGTEARGMSGNYRSIYVLTAGSAGVARS